MGVNSANSFSFAVALDFGSMSSEVICSGTVVSFRGDPVVPLTGKFDNDSTELSMGDMVDPPSMGGGEPKLCGDRKLRTSGHSRTLGTTSKVCC